MTITTSVFPQKTVIRRSPKLNETKKIDDHTTKGSHNGHDWVDLGLPSGRRWATMNIGANDINERGDVYTWGSVSPAQYTKGDYKSVTRIGWEEYFDFKEFDQYNNCVFYKYNNSPDANHQLDSVDDVAFQKWGGKWRLPTKEEFEELVTKCKWVRKMVRGLDLYIIIGPNGNRIQLPSSYDKSEGYDWGWYFYWTKTLDTSRTSEPKYDYHDSYAYQYIRSALGSYEGVYGFPQGHRCTACHIRPVF